MYATLSGMLRVRCRIALATVCVVAVFGLPQAGAIPLNVTGFGGAFGDLNDGGIIQMADGSVTTDNTGVLTADVAAVTIGLSTWSFNSDAVGLTDLVLTGTGDISGSATYEADSATLTQMLYPPPIGIGVIQATMTLESNTLTSGVHGAVGMPSNIDLLVSYNGVTVTTNGSFGTSAVTDTATASFSAVPEPAALSLLVLGGVGLLWRRRRRA